MATSKDILDAMYQGAEKVFEIKGRSEITGFVMHPTIADALIKELEAQYLGSWIGLGIYANYHIQPNKIIAFGSDGRIKAIFDIHDDPK